MVMPSSVSVFKSSQHAYWTKLRIFNPKMYLYGWVYGQVPFFSSLLEQGARKKQNTSVKSWEIKIGNVYTPRKGYICISRHFQVSWGSTRGISRARGRALRQITRVTDAKKSILSRKIEWQLARYVAKNPRTTLKTLANDLTKSGI